MTDVQRATDPLVTHLDIEYWRFCRLVRGQSFRARPGDSTCDGSKVTCPDCLVALDQFIERGLKPKRSKWPYWSYAKKDGALRIGTDLWFSHVRIVWKFRPKRREHPWSRASVAALAKKLWAEEEFDVQPPPIFSDGSPVTPLEPDVEDHFRGEHYP